MIAHRWPVLVACAGLSGCAEGNPWVGREVCTVLWQDTATVGHGDTADSGFTEVGRTEVACDSQGDCRATISVPNSVLRRMKNQCVDAGEEWTMTRVATCAGKQALIPECSQSAFSDG